MSKSQFEQDGFLVIDRVIDDEAMHVLTNHCETEVNAKVGTRNLLALPWVKQLAQKLAQNDSIKRLLPKNAVVVQCNYFSKDLTNNLSVTPHRDLSIPVKSRIESVQWSGWSHKEGVLYAQPPKNVLSNVLAIRVHLEKNDNMNGALEIVPGSHKDFTATGKQALCAVAKGGALLMRPLALHSSSKLRSGKRRVLHFVYGPNDLPDGASWANAVPV